PAAEAAWAPRRSAPGRSVEARGGDRRRLHPLTRLVLLPRSVLARRSGRQIRRQALSLRKGLICVSTQETAGRRAGSDANRCYIQSFMISCIMSSSLRPRFGIEFSVLARHWRTYLDRTLAGSG